jgi:hypothetical protein
MKCPSCAANGLVGTGKAFEPRGRYDGFPVYKCGTCNGGVRVTNAGRAMVTRKAKGVSIPAAQWQQMKNEFGRHAPPAKASTRPDLAGRAVRPNRPPPSGPMTNADTAAEYREAVYTFDGWDDRTTAALVAGMRQRSIPYTWKGEELVIRREFDAAVDGLIATLEEEYNSGESDGVANPKAESAAARADIAESLRQLKALHAESLLTDDEYETKRQGLADQL